jgi:hypothetical protein
VQQSIRLLFETFRRLGSAIAVVKALRRQGLQFPRRRCGGLTPRLLWGALSYSYALTILHNPRYAGAYVYGRNATAANRRAAQW